MLSGIGGNLFPDQTGVRSVCQKDIGIVEAGELGHDVTTALP